MTCYHKYIDNKGYTMKNNRYHLTERENEVLKEVVNGKKNYEIAKILSVSSHTVKFYISSIFYKLSVNSRLEAAVKAIKEELL